MIRSRSEVSGVGQPRACHAMVAVVEPVPLGALRTHLALGSNLGDRAANLREALCRLGARLSVGAVSNLYETRPMGPSGQPWYLNAVCVGWTTLEPEELLAFAKRVEREMGRVPTVRWGPRVIDIDVLFYGDLVFKSATLVIPHPGIPHRLFVLRPLSDVDPGFVHPVLGESIASLLNRLTPEPGEIRQAASTEEWYSCTK